MIVDFYGPCHFREIQRPRVLIVFKVDDLKAGFHGSELQDPMFIGIASKGTANVPNSRIHEGQSRHHFFLEYCGNVHSVFIGQLTLGFIVFRFHFLFGGARQIQGHALIGITARFGGDSGLVSPGSRTDGIACPADHTFDVLAIALGADHLQGII